MSLRAADPKLAARVGALTLLVLLLAGTWLLFLRGKYFLGPAVHVGVYFGHAGSLKEGAPVMVAGRQVGKVESIRLVQAASAEAVEQLGGAGGAVARIRIEAASRDMVPHNGEFFVSSRGLLAERYLEIGPPAAGALVERSVAEGDRVRGADPPSMDRVLQNTWTNLTIARAFLEEVGPEAKLFFDALDKLRVTLGELEPAPGELDRLIARGKAAADQATITMLSLEAGGATPADLTALAGRARRTMTEIGLSTTIIRLRLVDLGDGIARVRDRIEAAMPGLEAKIQEAFAAVDTAMAKMEGVSAKVSDLLGIIERGEGSLGRLANDPEFPEDAKELGKILKRQPWRVLGHPQDDEP